MWEPGERGEEAVGATLGALTPEHLITLHDRRMRDADGRLTKANIDHIAVAAGGVWVVDAKTHSGSLEVRRSGGWFSRQTERLFIRGRDQTDLRLGVTKQVAAVRAELALKVPTYEPDGPNDASPRAIAAPHRQRPGRRQQRDLAERAER